MRELLDEARESDDRRARLAVEIFCYRARKYIGAYLAALGGADAVIFTGGIGENAAEVRAAIVAGLGWFGAEVDPERNAAASGGQEGRIDREGGRLELWVIPTDEELLIARDTFRVVHGLESRF
jgi:acetate kinase